MFANNIVNKRKSHRLLVRGGEAFRYVEFQWQNCRSVGKCSQTKIKIKKILPYLHYIRHESLGKNN